MKLTDWLLPWRARRALKIAAGSLAQCGKAVEVANDARIAAEAKAEEARKAALNAIERMAIAEGKLEDSEANLRRLAQRHGKLLLEANARKTILQKATRANGIAEAGSIRHILQNR